MRYFRRVFDRQVRENFFYFGSARCIADPAVEAGACGSQRQPNHEPSLFPRSLSGTRRSESWSLRTQACQIYFAPAASDLSLRVLRAKGRSQQHPTLQIGMLLGPYLVDRCKACIFVPSPKKHLYEDHFDSPKYPGVSPRPRPKQQQGLVSGSQACLSTGARQHGCLCTRIFEAHAGP